MAWSTSRGANNQCPVLVKARGKGFDDLSTLKIGNRAEDNRKLNGCPIRNECPIRGGGWCWAERALPAEQLLNNLTQPRCTFHQKSQKTFSQENLKINGRGQKKDQISALFSYLSICSNWIASMTQNSNIWAATWNQNKTKKGGHFQIHNKRKIKSRKAGTNQGKTNSQKKIQEGKKIGQRGVLWRIWFPINRELEDPPWSTSEKLRNRKPTKGSAQKKMIRVSHMTCGTYIEPDAELSKKNPQRNHVRDFENSPSLNWW